MHLLKTSILKTGLLKTVTLATFACGALVFGLAACGGGSDETGDGDSQTVEENGVRLELPRSVSAGAPFEVKWEGPGNSGDYLSVAEEGSDDDAYENYTRTREGSPLTLRPPDRPGSYEVRYLADDEGEVLARAPLTVEEVSAEVQAPAKVGAGSPIEVTWKGPANPGDYISIAEKGTDDDAYANYTRTRDGSPLSVRAPDTPGAYELRYVLDQADRVVAWADVTVTSVSASLDVADTLMVDTPVEISWEGPGNPGDYISIAEAGSEEDAYQNYTRTREGNPLTIRTPERPGSYEVRYMMDQSDRAIARKPLVVLPLQARLRAPDSVAAGTGLKVSWIGPNGPDDFVAIASPEASATDYESRALTRAGNPAAVFAPSSSGAYELRYVWAEEDSVLQRKPLDVIDRP
jgi:Ca-activated chloride channel family protein